MLSVIITVKNGASTIEYCINRVLEVPPDDKEVVVVYGKSKDRTYELIKQFEGKVKIVEDDQGIGSAINSGVLNSKGDIIAYVEDHSVVEKEFFVKGLDYLEKHPSCGYLVFYRHIPPSCGFNKVQSLINFMRSLDKGQVMGQFRMFRRQAFFDAGGFWVFPKMADDLEFATRLYETKWKMGIAETSSWDYPRWQLRSVLKKYLSWGKSEGCWFRIYRNHPFLTHEMATRKGKKPILTEKFSILYYYFIKNLLAPVYAFRVSLEHKNYAFFPFYVAIKAMYVLGFVYGFHFWGKKAKWMK
jgi:glycosyltransferase involved in cell wall biosynthesis